MFNTTYQRIIKSKASEINVPKLLSNPISSEDMIQKHYFHHYNLKYLFVSIQYSNNVFLSDLHLGHMIRNWNSSSGL